MGVRFQKRIKVLPGVTLNISKSGVGYSLGPEGLHFTRSVHGGWTRNVDLPMGFSSRTAIGDGPRKKDKAASRSAAPAKTGRAAAAPETAPAGEVRERPRPGMLAPRWEKDLFAALDDPSTIGTVAMEHQDNEPSLPVLCAALEGLWLYEQGDHARAGELLAWAADNGGGDLGAHPFVRKYLSDAAWTVAVCEGAEVALTLAQDAVLLAAAECRQAAGDLAGALRAAQAVDPPTTASALSLAELYAQARRDQEVLDLTDGVDNLDDLTALLLVFRGRTFASQGHYDAARETFKQALSSRSRSQAVRHRALLERARANAADGKKAAARKDIETVLAADPDYPGLRRALAALTA